MDSRNDISPIHITPTDKEMEQLRKDIETDIIRGLMIPVTIINNPLDTNYSSAKMNEVNYTKSR